MATRRDHGCRLQDPPAVLTDFVKAWRAGYDVAYGARLSRRGDDLLKRQSAAVFYKIFNAISPLKIPHDAGDFRIMDRRAVLALRQLRERNRFMKGIFSWVGFSVVAVHYPRPRRMHGASKFRIGRLWNFALDGLFGFSTIPLKAWTYCGLVIAVGAIAYALFLVIRTLIHGIGVPGYASLMVVMLVGVATQLISMGMFGEYLARLTAEAKSRPLYIVEHHYGQADIGSAEAPPQA